MKHTFRVTIAILFVNVFVIPVVVMAQNTVYPYQQPNQYQQLPPNEVNPPQQAQPPTNQPTTQTPPPEPVATPQEQPTLYQGDAPLPTTSKVLLPPLGANSASARQFKLSAPGLYLLFAVIVMFALFWFGWWRKLLKHKKTTNLPAEDDGTVCKTCGGKGTITKKRTITAPCNHCKQTGRDICHHCGGTGRYNGGFTVPQTQEEVESLMKCDYCEGSGFKTPVLPCCMCKGKKKEETQESYEETCPTCKGTGRIAR